MIPNNTIIDRTTTITNNEIELNNYDHTGAMVYIIIVLLWYSIGIIFMLGMQMRARSETIEASARHRTKLLIRNLRDHTNTKEILEELVDKHKRARLWDIYLGTKTNPDDAPTRAESVRIRHIEKQLAEINRNRRLTNDTLFESEEDINYFRSRSDSRQVKSQLSTIEEPIPVSTLRRRSSLDEQTLEQLKALANQSKSPEQVPWNTRKLMIQKYFRRYSKKSSPISQQESTEDNLSSFTDHIDTLTRNRSESDFNETSPYDEKRNPYITYFYQSTNRPNILATEFFSGTV